MTITHVSTVDYKLVLGTPGRLGVLGTPGTGGLVGVTGGLTGSGSGVLGGVSETQVAG